MNITSYLPPSLKAQIENRPIIRKIISNTGWLTLQKIFKLTVGFVVGVLVARHLGPRDFGILSYAYSIAAFFGTFVYLGLSGIFVRDLIKHPEETELLMGSGFLLKVVGAILGYIAIVILTLAKWDSAIESWVLLILGASLFFRPLEIMDFWFQSKNELRYSVFAQGISFIIVSTGKIILVVIGASVLSFAVLGLTEFALGALFLLIIYSYKRQNLLRWKIRFSKIKSLLEQSWALIISGLFSLVYLRIDQVMLRWISGAEEVGIYSVATRFSEVWYFIPNIIVASVFPSLVAIRQNNIKKYTKKLQQGFDILFSIAFIIAIIIALASVPLITLLFGPEYSRSGNILMVHVWAGVFIFMRALFSKWIIIEDVIIFSVYSQGLGALVNIALNLALIRNYGGYGAAIATLFSYAAASYFMLFFTKRTRPMALMMTWSLVLPLRLIQKGKNIYN